MKEMPQIGKNGISHDYINEWGWIYDKLRTHKLRGTRLTRDELVKGLPIKKYEEKFPAYKYSNVINNANRVIVAQINLMVDEMNKRISTGIGFSLDLLVATEERVAELVYGH